MRFARPYALLSLALACGLIAAGSAWSQQPARPTAPATPGAAPAPEATTATYGDWVVRCAAPTGAPPRRVCEVAQTIQIQGQQGPVAQLAIGRVERNDPLRMTLVLPTNVFIPNGVKVVSGEQRDPPVQATFQRCIPGGCFAEAQITDDALRRFRARAEPGRIEFRDAANRDIAIPLSFRGFSSALDALPRE